MTTHRTGLDWLQRFGYSLQQRNIVVECGTNSAIAYLTFAGGGEGVTIADSEGATIYLRDTSPSVSAVLEEVAHAWQARRRAFEDEDAQVMIRLREIEAKECLLARRDRLGIPQPEHEASAAQLDRERKMLESLRARW